MRYSRPLPKSKAPPHSPRRKQSPHGEPTATVEIEALTWGGRGLARHEGKIIFVSKSVPGDKLLVGLERIKSRYAEGHVRAVLAPGPDRVEPKCKFFSHCGGCQWLNTAYARQLREKELLLRSILRRHLPESGPEAIVGADPDRGYRHKGDFHVHATGDTLRIGFYQEGSHHVVNLDFCLLFDRDYNVFYQNLRSVLRHDPRAKALERLTLDRDEEGAHYAAHLHLREGASAEEAAALARLGESAGLGGGLVTPAREPGRILARWGRPWTRYTLPGAEAGAPGLRMQADVRSFTQAHYPMNRKLVERVREWLGLARHERLLDLYSGIGNFSIPLAPLCREVVAVESSPTAHEDTKENARINDLLNLRPLLGEAAPWVSKLAAASESFDAILLDPPRTGARELLETLVHLTPKRILYVSCNLPALERDLQILGEAGYRPIRVQAWDLFPQTYSVETLCLLSRS